MQDQKILGKTKSGIPPKVYQIPTYKNSTCWHTFDTHVVIQIIIFNYQKSIPLLLFVLKCLRPKSIGRADWPRTFWIQTRTLPYWGVTMKTRTSFLERGQFYTRPRARSLPRTAKAKLASLLHSNHQWREMPHNDPKAWLAAELALQCRRLQEQFPGAPALAMSWKQT